MPDKRVNQGRKIPVKMLETKQATVIKHGPGGMRRYSRLVESGNEHAMEVIKRATDKDAWCAVTIEANLAMIHINLKDVSKAYAYLFSFDEFYAKENPTDTEYKGYDLISNSLMGYSKDKYIVSSRTLYDD